MNQTLILLTFLFLLSVCHCKPTSKTTLKQRWDKAYNQLSQEAHTFIDQFRDQIDSSKKAQSFGVVLVDHEFFVEPDSICQTAVFQNDIETTPNISFTHGLMRNDTLFFSVSYFMNYQKLNHILTKHGVDIEYDYHYKTDMILKEYENDEVTNRLALQMIVEKFEISTRNPSFDEIVFGYAKIHTPPYYKLGEGPCKEYRLARRDYEYYFKFRNNRYE